MCTLRFLFWLPIVFAIGGLSTAQGQIESVLPLTQKTNTEASTRTTEKTEVASPSEGVPNYLRTPRATMQYFLKMTNLSNYKEAAGCLDLSAIAKEERGSRGEELAYRLKAVLDRFEVISLEEIPNAPNGPDFEYKPDWRFHPFIISGSADRPWLFTRETVGRIDKLFEQLKALPLKAGQNWLCDIFPMSLQKTAFLLPHYQWISLLVVIFIGFLIDLIVRMALNRLTVGWLKFRRVKVNVQLEQGIWKPVGLLSMAFTWYIGTKLIGLPPQVLQILLVAVHFFTIVTAVWTAFRVIDLLANYLAGKASHTQTKFDDLLIPLVSRSLKVLAVCLGLLIFAEAFDLPITGVLSGLGIGGIALALAAKDTLGNLFGSLTVLVDRPFEIGDWIVADKVEGTVETVGMRSTRVRTFYNSLITVPNSLLTTAIVDNMGSRRYRRIKTMLALQYDTSHEKIDAFCEGVRELIRRHPYTRKDYYHVYFNQFSASSLDVLLYCFLECPDWAIELRERHRLFVDILKLGEQLGVSFAFPTRTLYMFQGEKPGEKKLEANSPLELGRHLGAEIAGPLPPPDQRPGPVEFMPPAGE